METEFVKGDLFGFGESRNGLYREAFFISENFGIRFYPGIGGGFPIENSHVEEDDRPVYYPYYNETTADLYFGDSKENFSLIREEVYIKLLYDNDNGLFVQTQNEITAYSGAYIVNNGNVYRILDSLLMSSEATRFEQDELLEINNDDFNEPIVVKNVETEYCKPLERCTVERMIENNENNGAVKVHLPDESRMYEQVFNFNS